MKRRRKSNTALPRLTVLAYSKAELQRFSQACEYVASWAGAQEGLLARIESILCRLEALTASAGQTRRPRRAAAVPTPPAEG